MMSGHRLHAVLVCMFLMTGPTEAFGQNDAQGCQDHPLITRMPNFYIRLCEGSEFDRYEFSSESGPITVEGKKTVLYYSLKDGATAPSATAIVRNHINAIEKIGGTVVYDGGSRATLKVTKDKQEIWVGVDGAAAYEYTLAIVEKGEIRQEIVATAEGMTKEITTRGRIALYGIYFDTGKTDIRPESAPVLDEVANLRADMERIADRFRALFRTHVDPRYRGAKPGELAKLTDAIRRLPTGSVRIATIVLSQAIERGGPGVQTQQAGVRAKKAKAGGRTARSRRQV